MDNPVAALLQFLEQSRKRHGGCGMNIMQQQDATPFGFEALHSTLLGNTVVENAEVTIIQVDPDFPKLAWKRREG